MNIQLHQTVELKSGYCKGKILPENISTETWYLVQLIEGMGSKISDYPIGSKLIVLKGNCWKYTQKIKVRGEVVSEQRIAFHISDIIGTIVDVKDDAPDEPGTKSK